MSRTKPHIKVHLSVADHRKTSAVWADVRTRGMLVELWRKAGEKFAGKTADRVGLKPTDRMDIAGTTDQPEADQAVTALCSAMKYELRRYPNRWEVRVRKFSKKQGYADNESQAFPSEQVQRTPASESESDTKSNSEAESKKERAPAPRSSLCPDELSGDESIRAVDWAAGKGFTGEQLAYGWERVRDWSRSKSVKRADWLAVLRNAMTDGWALKGFGQSPTGEHESPAQAKARRTKEAAAKAYEMIQQSQQRKLGLIEGGAA